MADCHFSAATPGTLQGPALAVTLLDRWVSADVWVVSFRSFSAPLVTCGLGREDDGDLKH